MRIATLTCSALIALAAAASGQIPSYQPLSGSFSGGGNYFGFDVEQLPEAQTTWAGGVLGGRSFLGTTFRRAVPDARPVDPNLVDYIVPDPDASGGDDRLVTFVGAPHPDAEADARFSEPPDTINGNYRYTPTYMYRVGAGTGPSAKQGPGYWARLVVNLPADVAPEDVYLLTSESYGPFPNPDNPAHRILAAGTLSLSVYVPSDVNQFYGYWVIAAVPEPGTGLVIALAVLLCGRRRT